MKRVPMLFVVLLVALIVPAYSSTLLEDFNAPFPAWESGWLGTNSNAQNYYGVGQGRGNNPDGLWIQDNTPSDQDILIQFNSTFAATLTSINFDVAGHVLTNLRFFDASGNPLLNISPITVTSGALTLPGVYVNYGVTSITGIGGFEFYGNSPEGNTSIDNIVASTDSSPVPEPTSLLLLGTGLGGLALAAWRRRK